MSCTCINKYPDHCQNGTEQVCQEVITLKGNSAKYNKQNVRLKLVFCASLCSIAHEGEYKSPMGC